MDKLVGVYGTGGFGIEVMPLLRLQFPELEKNCFVYVIDDGYSAESSLYETLSYSEFLKHPATDKSVAIAIGNSKARESISKKLTNDNIKHINVKAENVTVLDGVSLGEGSILCGHVSLTSNIKIGKFFHANIYSYVAHDCIIGDYVTFAPRVNCNGRVHIHDHAYIGTGAVIKEGSRNKPLVIGEGAVIGMGAVVTKDVPAGAVVVGNPARPLQKK